MIYPRYSTDGLIHALDTDSVIFLTGARRVGKSTLMQQLVNTGQASEYVTFDAVTERQAAQADPEGYVSDLAPRAVIDEVQRVPQVLLAIKTVVDSDPKPGRFLLTGSADVLILPQVADALTGRMRKLTLWPLSQGELAGKKESFIGRLFKPRPNIPSGEQLDKSEIIERALVGGYPQMIEKKFEDRLVWAEDYVEGLIQRDVREIAGIKRLDDLSRLVKLIAARAPGLLNASDYARALALPVATLKRYLAWLEYTYVIRRVPAWYRNIGQRLVKSEKLILNDSGLLAGLLGLNPRLLRGKPEWLGALIENFVGMELVKQLGFAEAQASLLHYRDHKGAEVDYVLESPLGELVGIEIKAAQSVDSSDFRGLSRLRDRVGDSFVRGVLLYCGKGRVLPFGDRLLAAPLPALWQ